MTTPPTPRLAEAQPDAKPVFELGGVIPADIPDRTEPLRVYKRVPKELAEARELLQAAVGALFEDPGMEHDARMTARRQVRAAWEACREAEKASEGDDGARHQAH